MNPKFVTLFTAKVMKCKFKFLQANFFRLLFAERNNVTQNFAFECNF